MPPCWFWQPQIALFVNEPTRLPLFVALAPSATVIQRTTQTAAAVFTAFGLSKKFITREVTEMGSHQLTANVQVADMIAQQTN